MTEDDPRSIPVDQFPDPVLTYAVRTDRPVTRGVNDAFRSAFGAASADSPVEAVLERHGVAGADERATLADRLAGGERFRARLDVTGADGTGPTGRYVLRVVPGPADTGGHLVFTDVTDIAADGGGDSLGVDRVASVVSHDLRNPLDVAKARLRAGRETGDDEHFERVAQAHDRMERIVRDVLTLARGEEAMDRPESVALAAVAREAWDTVDTGTATLTVDGPLPTVRADPDRAQRLFENLFRNSVEHGSTSPRSQPTGETGDDLTVRVGPLESASIEGFFLADDGPGIPPDEREAVFDPGYSSHEHGAGLGLAIVERIASAHGWTIGATAGADGGARFEVRVDPQE